LTERDFVDSKPTIVDVAHLAGVSPATVSHVLNKTKRVAPETEEKVLQAVRALKYQKNILASALRSCNYQVVGFITSQLHNTFWLRIIRAVEYTLSRSGYQMFLGCSYGNPLREVELIESMFQSMVKGIIIATCINEMNEKDFAINPRVLSFLEERCVFVDTRPSGIDVDFVGVNNEEASFQLVEFLLKKGYRRIAMVNGDPRILTARERRDGFFKALNKYGVSVDKRYVFEGENLGRKTGFKGAKYLLSLEPLPEAVFLASGNLTIGFLEGCREKGVRVPEDVELVSFDDIEWNPMIEPFLTCCVQPSWDIGETAVSLLFEKIREGKRKRLAKEIRLKCEVIIREK
jgi:LacI family transcriptional regulator